MAGKIMYETPFYTVKKVLQRKKIAAACRETSFVTVRLMYVL